MMMFNLLAGAVIGFLVSDIFRSANTLHKSGITAVSGEGYTLKIWTATAYYESTHDTADDATAMARQAAGDWLPADAKVEVWGPDGRRMWTHKAGELLQ